MASLKKLTRSEFVALIGYDGLVALVDKKFAAKYGKKNALELAKLGYYRAAICATIYDNEENGGEKLVQWLHSHDIFDNHTYQELKTLFGVTQVEEVKRVITI